MGKSVAKKRQLSVSKNIKILLVGHTPFQLLEGDFWLPIHAGREIAEEHHKDGFTNTKDIEWLKKYTVGDNSGDNISTKNRYYSECSTLYWAWKNYDKINAPDYIGLMHYRRHFVFNENYYNAHPKEKENETIAYIDEEIINDKYLENIGLNDKNILNACEKYDLIISKDADFKKHIRMTIREDYIKRIPDVDVKDFDLMVNKIDELHPEYSEITHEFINGYKKSLYQMFIMKKELFFEYCQFLFDILFAVEKESDFSEYTTSGKRTLGYLAENLLSIFVLKKISEGVLTLKLGVTRVECAMDKTSQQEFLKKGYPKYSKYLKHKFLAMFSTKKTKETHKKIYREIRNNRKLYKIIEKHNKEIS